MDQEQALFLSLGDEMTSHTFIPQLLAGLTLWAMTTALSMILSLFLVWVPIYANFHSFKRVYFTTSLFGQVNMCKRSQHSQTHHTIFHLNGPSLVYSHIFVNLPSYSFTHWNGLTMLYFFGEKRTFHIC